MMNNYQVLYRDSVEYSYLVLFYQDLANSPRTTPQTFYAFPANCDDTESCNVIAPMVVKNIHGSEVYRRYLDRGWQDVTNLDNYLPSSIKSWLSEQVERRNYKI